MDEKLQRHLGETARATRLRLGLTQAEVAQQVRLKPAVYGRVERGKMTPSVPSLRRICTVLGLSSDLLLSLALQEGEGVGRQALIRAGRAPGAEPHQPPAARLAPGPTAPRSQAPGDGPLPLLQVNRPRSEGFLDPSAYSSLTDTRVRATTLMAASFLLSIWRRVRISRRIRGDSAASEADSFG